MITYSKVDIGSTTYMQQVALPIDNIEYYVSMRGSTTYKQYAICHELVHYDF